MTELICDADGIRLSPSLVLAERRHRPRCPFSD